MVIEYPWGYKIPSKYLFNRYIFIDKFPRVSIDVFNRYKVLPIEYKYFANPHTRVLIAFAVCSKRKAERFEQAMNEVMNTALLSGHDDYDKAVEKAKEYILENNQIKHKEER